MNSTPFLAGWERASGILKWELLQLIEEGRDPLSIKKLADSIDLDRADESTLAGLWYRLQEARLLSTFAFTEPGGLDEIRAEGAPAARKFAVSLSKKELLDRMHGAWLGRCGGCALGKPVEGFQEPRDGLSSKERIKTYLLGVSPDEYPLRNYFPGSSSATEKTGTLWSHESQREKIA